MDCITQEQSTRICYQAIGRCGGHYAALDPYPEKVASRKVVEPGWILATAITGRGCMWPEPYARDGKPELREFGKPIFRSLQRLLDQGKIVSHPPKVCGDVSNILEGVNDVRRGKVRGEKLVFTM
jgi:hypothetical protein